MFGAEPIARGLSLSKVISGISKTLSIANQVIPIYQQTKPMINNARNAFRVLKEFTKPSSNTENKSIINDKIPEKVSSKNEKIESSSNYNNPIFFL